MTDLSDVRAAVRAFTTARAWSQFHDPKSLTLALAGEVGEVAELLQWLPADRVAELVTEEPLRSAVTAELADVFVYLLLLADVCGVDLAKAATDKLAASAAKYPADTYRGRAPDHLTQG